MASTLVLTLVKYGLLVLLWLFIIAAVRVVRADLFGAGAGAAPARQAKPQKSKPAPAVAPPVRKRSQARRLVVTEGALAGVTVELGDREITLGRAEGSALVLTDDYASNHHARLVPGDGTWVLEDLGSTNGTFLGQSKVTRPTPVPLGAQIRIGKTALELRR